MEQPENNIPANRLYDGIREILMASRSQIAKVVNATLLHTYWQVGRHIVEFEQGGYVKSEYGSALINELSKRLVAEFGKGFTPTNLRYMRQFYLYFPIYHSVRDKLSWTHYRSILKVEDPKARDFYIQECISENWSTRQLDRQINTLYYQRLLASRDKETVRNEIQHSEPRPLEPREIIRDPYVLEFLGIPQGEHFLALQAAALFARTRQRLFVCSQAEADFVWRQAFLHRPRLL